MGRYFTFIFLFFTFSLCAQNWEPVHKGYIYNYYRTDDNSVYSIIPIGDTVIEGDSAIILKKGFEVCKNCFNQVANRVNPKFRLLNYDLHILNRPFFLNSFVSKTNKGWIFSDPGKQFLKRYPFPGEEWVFDSIRSINAKFIGTIAYSIFGKPDSARVILLSTNDTIIQSKNFGIIEYPSDSSGNSYRLLGIEGLQVGLKIPQYYQQMDYQAGDRFEIGHKDYTWDLKFYGIEQFVVTSKLAIPGGYRYKIRSYKLKNGILTRYFYTEDWIPYDVKDLFPNYESSPLHSDARSYYYDQRLNRIILFNDSHCQSWKPVTANSDTFYEWWFSGCDDYDIIRSTNGLPYLFYDSYGVGGEYRDSLFAFKKGTEYYGDFTSLDTSIFNIGIDDQGLDFSTIKIYPNPANDFLEIQFENPSSGLLKISLLDITGNELITDTWHVTPGIQKKNINISTLPAGLYMLKLSTSAIQYSSKFIIQRQ